MNRNRVNNALVNNPSPSSSSQVNGKGKEAVTAATQSTSIQPHDQRDSRSKNNVSDDESETENKGSDNNGFDEEATSWIPWFCSQQGNEFYCEVDYDYIKDDFNLYDLSNIVPYYYTEALHLILDCESFDGDKFTEEENQLIDGSAEALYGLIHARYILTPKGMDAMFNKYQNCDFERCPRVYCNGQPCLPVGQSDIPGLSSVKKYCPKCEDIYDRSEIYDMDGAYIGTTFPHMFLMVGEHLKPEKATESYVPRVFGFKIHKP